MLLKLLVFLLCLSTADCLKFSVAESAKLGHIIGFISGHAEVSTTPTYFVVFPDEQISKFLKVDEKSGEISTIAQLDYEKRARFDFVAVRVADNADTIDITIDVVDENDNAPIFAEQHVKLKISEFAQIGATFALPSVIDGDGPQYTVQKFEILQGNVNNVFRVATRRDDDDNDANQPKQADLVVNGQLDREFRDSYELLIEARDGGDKRGQLRVSIAILDANDMAPIFGQTRYSATVAPNITVGAKICQVRAVDGDVGENARVSYEIRKTAAPSNSLFQISRDSGVISATAPLLAASTHDLIVVARDHGSPSLSTSTVVTITVLGSSLAAPPLDVIWLVESNSAHLMENATLGSIVARVSVAREYRDTTRLKLIGCNALCPQQTDISHVYLLLLCGVLDRETQPEYQLKFMLENEDGRIVVEHPQLLTIGDINDNYPHWHTSQIHISLNRTSRDGGGTRTLTATDADAGANGWIKYTILDTDRVAIDAETGRVYVRGDIGCDAGAELRFRVRAEDGGQPALFSDLQVVADLVDAESRPPQFEKSMWQVEIAEDVPIGTCLVKVVANSSQCGNSKRIRYSMRDAKLSIDSISGTVCLIDKLDYEQSKTYQATVIATNSNAETSTSLISINLKDVNDNWPIFYPSEYQLTLREGQSTPGALLVVSATDADPFGEIAYHLLSDSTTFSINSSSGEIAAKTALSRGKYHLLVGAKDGAGLTAEHAANVHIDVIDAAASVPQFSRMRYEIRTTEDILPGIAIGSVAVMSPAVSPIRYSIYSGDPQSFFSIDEASGKIYVQRYLDADVVDRIVLNVEARIGDMSNQTQVMIYIEDHNDNSPIFENDVVEIFVKEDQPVNQPFYMIRAVDKDKRDNGDVVYSLISSHPAGGVHIDATSGRISTSLSFDYETTRDFKVRFKASDRGIPAKSSNMTLFIHIVDVNDNSPRFGDEPQHMEVVEMSAAKTIIGRVVATDRDAGRNGEVAYRVTNGSDYFGVDERLGDVYTKRAIDREVMSFVDVTIVAEDRGEPHRRQTAKSWRVQVADINDNAPSCATISPIVVALDAPPSMCIGTIVATDADKGLNGSVLYRSQLESPLFVVKANGDVYLRRALNSTATHQRLSIIVSDQGTPRKSAVCHVDIRITAASSSSAIVLHEPVERFIEIGEQCAKHTCRLASFNATGVHMWQIQSSEIANHFQLRDGVLTMLSWPTTHRPPYTLTIIMSDEMGRQKSLQLRMTLAKDAANREQIVRINESMSIGTRVGRLGEKDPAVFYTSNNTCPLEVDQTTGTLYLAALASQQKCEFVRVNTTDGDETLMDVQIEVAKSRNAKGGPKFDADNFVINVEEDVPVGSVIWSAMTNLTTQDDQEMEAISWRFAVANEKFAIDQFTGDVSLLETLHWHEKSTYNLAIEAFTRRTTSILLTINILDVDDHPPTIISSSDLYLPSILRKGSKVHRVIARDLDNHSTIRYKLKTISKLLKINETSGEMLIRSSDAEAEKMCVVIAESAGKVVEQIITIHPSTLNHSWHYFDDQKMTTHSTSFDLPTSSVEHVKLTVISPEVYDLNGLKIRTNTSTTMTILAESQNDVDYTVINVALPIPLDFSPLKIASTSCGVVSVRENVEIAMLRRVVVQGARSATFRFQGSVEKEFWINSTSGMIGLGSSLDREKRQEHLLVVMVEDRGRTDSCTVRVIVTDTNDNTPQFHPSSPDVLTISPSTNIGDVLHTFDATDADISLNGKLTFDLIRDESQSLDLIPETGSLVLRRRSPLAEWTIKCRVSDQGVPKLHQDIDIRIVNGAANLSRDTGDELVAFLKQSYVSSVDESLPRGQFVGKIAVVPEDVGIAYSIVEGNVDSAFAIDSDGVIRTNLELDKEIVDQYNLRIIGIPVAQQQRQQQISTRFDIRVNNLNDNAPFFSATLPRKISESTPVGTYIATIQAKDVDQLDALQYSIASDGDADASLFEIDMFSGNIHLVAPLDYEKTTRHVLRIRATDGEFVAYTNLTINVIDVNDNAPTFAKPVYNVRTDSLIDVDCAASDADTQTTLHYTISPADDVATIGATTGMVRLRMLPPVGERHVLTVTVSDGKFKSAVPLIIATTTAPESRVDVGRVASRDFRVADNSEIGTLVGSLVDGFDEEEDYLKGHDDFEIDRFGRIFVARPLEASHINFETVTETGRRFNVTIHVENVNNDAPQFTQSIYSIALKDSMQHGQVIGKVFANDANDIVTYHILSGNDYNVITLSQSSGNVIFNEWNDATPLRIFIEARDSAANTAIATILLNLKYSTATAPFFVLPAYDVHVVEGAAIGAVIWRARASNRLGDATAKNWMYSLKDVSANEFAIDLMTGDVRNKIHLDWESQTVYEMQLAVADGNGRSAVVPLRIHVAPRDEFAPVFVTRQMTFRVATTAAIGDVVGEIRAVDEDAGIHGVVRYSILDRQSTVRIDEQGNIILLKNLSQRKNVTIEKFDIVAYSSRQRQTRATVYLEIGDFATSLNPRLLLHSPTVQIATISLVLLLATLILLLCICMCRARVTSANIAKKSLSPPPPPPIPSVYSVQTGEIRVLSGDIATSSRPQRHRIHDSMSSSSTSSVLRVGATTKSHHSQIDSGCDPAGDDESLNSSVTDYLVALGVNANPIPPRIKTTTTYDSLVNDYIYARVDDVLPPGPINLNTPNQHAMLRREIMTRKPPIIPSFEPLTEIFNEICEQQKEYVQVEI